MPPKKRTLCYKKIFIKSHAQNWNIFTRCLLCVNLLGLCRRASKPDFFRPIYTFLLNWVRYVVVRLLDRSAPKGGNSQTVQSCQLAASMHLLLILSLASMAWSRGELARVIALHNQTPFDFTSPFALKYTAYRLTLIFCWMISSPDFAMARELDGSLLHLQS